MTIIDYCVAITTIVNSFTRTHTHTYKHIKHEMHDEFECVLAARLCVLCVVANGVVIAVAVARLRFLRALILAIKLRALLQH